jgi:glycosyltransferase involved in cell wall biosynthesis
MPVRRRRWDRENRASTAPYVKAARPDRAGVALAAGDFSGLTGLSRAAVYEAERLRAEHGRLELLDIRDFPRDGAAPALRHGPQVGTLYLLAAPNTYPVLLRALPPERIARAHRVGLWVWETPRFPEDWRFALDLVHEVWTPTGFSRRALDRADPEVPVRVRPHPVSPPPEIAPLDRAALGVAPDAFLGLAAMDLRSCPARKNPWAHVAAWQRAFGDDPSAVLILKLSTSKRTGVVRRELASMIGGAGNIRLMDRQLTAAEMAGLQQGADVFLSLHRAEGYGLNIHESLLLGTPVVATDWSGSTEFARGFPHYHGVPCRMVPYRDWTRHYPEGGFHWAEADIAAAAETLCRLRAAAAAPAPALARPA